MGVEVPISSGVQSIAGEDRSARQLRGRNASSRPKGHSTSHVEPPEAADPLEVTETPLEITVEQEGDATGPALATANGLTLADVKAVYESS